MSSNCNKFAQAAGADAATIDLSSLMMLPGVIVSSREDRRDDDQLWDFVRTHDRQSDREPERDAGIEGSHMAETLEADCAIDRPADLTRSKNWHHERSTVTAAGCETKIQQSVGRAQFGGANHRSASRGANLRRPSRYQRGSHSVGQSPENVFRCP